MTDPEEPGEGADRRRFYRVSARIPIRVRALEPGESAALACEIAASRASDGRGLADPALRAAFASLERKLDLVLALLDPSGERPLARADVRAVELSAAGVALEAPEDLDPGDEVLVELQLPSSPPHRVRAIAHPVPLVGPAGADKLRRAFAFDQISDEDRDAIVRFSHEVQRSELRERAGRGGPR